MILVFKPLLIGVQPRRIRRRKVDTMVRRIVRKNDVQIVDSDLRNLVNGIACAAIKDGSASGTKNGFGDIFCRIASEKFTLLNCFLHM